MWWSAMYQSVSSDAGGPVQNTMLCLAVITKPIHALLRSLKSPCALAALRAAMSAAGTPVFTASGEKYADFCFLPLSSLNFMVKLDVLT